MQNQNSFDPNQNNTQSGGYNDFYGANNMNGQPNYQANPSFGTDPSMGAGYDPNAFYNQNQGFGQSDPNMNPSFGTDPNAPTSFSQPPLYDPNQMQMNSDPQVNPQVDSSFEEPKSGNRFLVIGVVVLIVVLIGVAGYIVFQYRDVLFGTSTPATTQTTDQNNNKDNTADDSNDSTNNPNTTNNGNQTSNATCLTATPTRLAHTDPNETPSQKAKLYNETNASCDWLKKSFAGKPGTVDQNSGQCLKSETCGLTVDSDGDGLTNIQEFNYQTDPLNVDSDMDKIADGDEVNVYSTDPKRNDSDGDTFVEGVEIVNCYDPNINTKTLPANDITKGKFTISRQNEIKNKIVINPLHEPTITTLKATTDPTAVSNGFSKCTTETTPVAPTTTTPTNGGDPTGGITTPPVTPNTTNTVPTSGNSQNGL